MSSYQITITPNKRAAGRFVSRVRRELQKALAEEEKANGTTQSDIARKIGVNRSVISREIRGHKDITLSRVGELAWAMNRRPSFALLPAQHYIGTNLLFTIPLMTANQTGMTSLMQFPGANTLGANSATMAGSLFSGDLNSSPIGSPFSNVWGRPALAALPALAV